MLGRIELAQDLRQRLQPARVGVEVPVELPDPVHLPEHEPGRRVGTEAVEEEAGRLPALPAVFARVDAQIGEEAVLGGDGWEHPSLESLLARAPHRLMRGFHVHAGMAVEDGADALALAHRPKDLLDHLLVDPPPGHAGAVVGRERARVSVQRREPGRRGRVAGDVQHLVRELDLVPRLDRELETEPDPRADDREGAAPVTRWGCTPGFGPVPLRSGSTDPLVANRLGSSATLAFLMSITAARP